MAAMLLVGIGCESRDPHAQAQRLDRRYGTQVYTWLVEHDPSRLDVAGAVPADPVPFVPDGSVRTVSADLPEACRRARHDRALLLAFIAARQEPRRDAALDCGVAVERDDAALIIAPV
ncbi:MAG: hypothetical protein M3R44_01530 [Candidatus Eremiobacteraeota bacterium]|nr:hypothetical protein [Candidatus Eremiobacteraeota bacterium]